MSDVIRVDPEALQRLATSCHEIASQLDGLGRLVFDSSEAALGDAGLANTLEGFHDGWSERRGALVDDLQAAAATLDTIAIEFSEVDAELGSQS